MFNVEEDPKVNPGKVKFRITQIIDANPDGSQLISKSSGIPMLKMGLALKDDMGQTEFVWTFLLANQRYKFKQLFFAIGKPQLYVSKGPLQFDAQNDLLGCTGECVVVLQEGNAEYPEPRTNVVSFVDPNAEPVVPASQFRTAASAEEATTQEPSDDALPF